MSTICFGELLMFAVIFYRFELKNFILKMNNYVKCIRVLHNCRGETCGKENFRETLLTSLRICFKRIDYIRNFEMKWIKCGTTFEESLL